MMIGYVPQYKPIRTKHDLFWGKMDNGVGLGLIQVFCLFVMSFGGGLPWWTGLLAGLLVAIGWNILVWKYNVHILHLGSGKVEDNLANLPDH